MQKTTFTAWLKFNNHNTDISVYLKDELLELINEYGSFMQTNGAQQIDDFAKWNDPMYESKTIVVPEV